MQKIKEHVFPIDHVRVFYKNEMASTIVRRTLYE